MTYVSKGEKIFEYQNPIYPDCTPPTIKRSDHRLKRFFSTYDKRAWDYCEGVRYRHLYDLISGSQTCLNFDECHRYVPLEDLIRILMAEKDAYIKELEDKLRKCCKEGMVDGKTELSRLDQELNNSREMLRQAMHKLQNIDEIVNENKKLHCRLRCSEEKIKRLKEKKKHLESELAELRSKSQIQMDLEKAKHMLSLKTREEETEVELGEMNLQNLLSSERDELYEKVKKLEKELEMAKKKEAEIAALKSKSQSSDMDMEEISKENECYKKKLASMKCLEKQIQELKKQGRALADKYRKESEKAAEQMRKMCQAMKELQSLRDERDSLRKRVDEMSSLECQYKNLQRKLQRVDSVIAENEMLNCKLMALDKLEKENEYLRCRLEQIQEVEMSAAEDKERIRKLQCAVADQEEEMKDLLCQIERLTSGRGNEELERLRCELYEKNSKLKLCEEQLAEIPMLEAEIDELRTKLQGCCREFAETKTSESMHQKIEVRFPASSKGISANYKTENKKSTSVLGTRREERIGLDPQDCKDMRKRDGGGSKALDGNDKKDSMSCEQLQGLLQSSKEIISCVLEDMNEHQKEMEELEQCNRAMIEEIEILKGKIGGADRSDLQKEINNYKQALEEKEKEIAALRQRAPDSDTDVEMLKDLNRQMKAELEAACGGLKEIANLEKLLQMEREARCKAERKLKLLVGDPTGSSVPLSGQPSKRQELEDDSDFDCCKVLQKEVDGLKSQITELNKLTNELKKENELLRELQQPCPDFSKEMDEKCALENLLSLLQAELDAFKGQRLSDECEALRNELKRVLEQNCQLKALLDCYRQRLDLEKKSTELAGKKAELGSATRTEQLTPSQIVREKEKEEAERTITGRVEEAGEAELLEISGIKTRTSSERTLDEEALRTLVKEERSREEGKEGEEVIEKKVVSDESRERSIEEQLRKIHGEEGSETTVGKISKPASGSLKGSRGILKADEEIVSEGKRSSKAKEVTPSEILEKEKLAVRKPASGVSISKSETEKRLKEAKGSSMVTVIEIEEKRKEIEERESVDQGRKAESGRVSGESGPTTPKSVMFEDSGLPKALTPSQGKVTPSQAKVSPSKGGVSQVSVISETGKPKITDAAREEIGPDLTLEERREVEKFDSKVAVGEEVKRPESKTAAGEEIRRPESVITAAEGVKRPDSTTVVAGEVKKPDSKTTAGEEIRRPESVTAAAEEVKRPDSKTAAGEEARKPDAVSAVAEEVRRPESITATAGEVKRPESKTAAGEEARKPDAVSAVAEEVRRPESITATAGEVKRPDSKVVAVEEAGRPSIAAGRLEAERPSSRALQSEVIGGSYYATIRGRKDTRPESLTAADGRVEKPDSTTAPSKETGRPESITTAGKEAVRPESKTVAGAGAEPGGKAAELEAEIDRLKNLLAEKEESLNTAKNNCNEMLKARDEQIKALKDENENLKAGISPTKETDADIQNLLKELDALKKENNDMAKELDMAKAAKAAGAPPGSPDALAAELDAYKQRLKQMEEENADKMKKLMDQHQKELINQEKAYNDNMSAMKNGYEGDIKKLAERHKLSIMKLQGLHEEEVQELNTNYENQMETMQTQSAEAIDDIAKGSAAKMKKITEEHDKEIKDIEAKFHVQLDEKESKYLEQLGVLQKDLTKSAEEIETLRKEAKEAKDADAQQLKAKHSREIQKMRRSSQRKISLMKTKMEEEKKKTDSQLEIMKKKLKEKEKTEGVCDCKFRRKARKPRDPTCPLDFNDVLEKILEEGLECLTFNEIALVHRKACCALEGMIMNSNVTPALEPPVGDGCPHTPLLEADKQQLLQRIFALENDIVMKQRQTQEAIINMEVAVKKERCRLQQLKNVLQSEQQKNSELKSMLTSQTKLRSDLEKERDELGTQASLHQSLCLEKTKQLDQEKKDKKCLEEEIDKLKMKIRQLCMALDASRSGSESPQAKDSEQLQSLKMKLEQYAHQEQRLAMQLDNEVKYRIQLQCQLQALRQSFRQMVCLPAVEKDMVSPNLSETKSAKERQNLDQINEKKNKTKLKSVKKHKK